MSNLIIPEDLNSEFKRTLFTVREEAVPFIERKGHIIPMTFDDAGEIISGADGIKPINTGFKAIIDDTNRTMVSVVTDKYQVFLNTTLVQMISEMADYLDMKVVLKEASLFGNSRTKYVFDFADYKVNVDNEQMTPRITILNSYGGENRLKVIGGAYVLVCSNGLMLNKVVEDFSKVHSGASTSIMDFGQSVKDVIENTLKAANEHFPLFKQKQLSEDALVDMMEYFPKSTNDNWIAYMNENGKIKNYYDMLQAGTYIITHEMNRTQESTHKLEQNFYNHLLKEATKSKS